MCQPAGAADWVMDLPSHPSRDPPQPNPLPAATARCAADVTFNVCLGREFTGAGLTFCGYMGQAHHRMFTYQHKHRKGHCVMHLGRRRHGADDLHSGERLNLIVRPSPPARESPPHAAGTDASCAPSIQGKAAQR